MLSGSFFEVVGPHDLEVGELPDETEEQHEHADADAADRWRSCCGPAATRRWFGPARLVGDAQQERQHDEVRDERRAAVRDERQRDAGERDHARHAAEDDDVCKPMIVARPAANSFENGRVASTAIRNALPTSSMKPMMTPTVPMSPSSSPIAENTKSVGGVRDLVGIAEAEPGAREPARAERVPRLDDLVAVAGRVLPRVEPRVDAHLNVPEAAWYAIERADRRTARAPTTR